MPLKIRWPSLVISVGIVASGLWASHSLADIDRDLRVIYAEYTLAATDLGHINGDLIRYRTSVIRAIEADAESDFVRITDALPTIHSRIEAAITRFVNASNVASSGKAMDGREIIEVKRVQAKIEDYIESSNRTLLLLKQRWRATSPSEARRLRDEAQRYAAGDAGAKFVAVTLELDELLNVVAQIAGEARKDADNALRLATVVVIGVSTVLAALVLAVPSVQG